MPNQIVPVTGLDTVGFNGDVPSTSLPPQAFNDVRNVRFRDNSVLKMEGEVNIFPNVPTFTDTDAIVKYTAWWPNPNLSGEYNGYYLVIVQKADTNGNQMDHTYLLRAGDTEAVLKGTFQPDDQGNWQHTFFQGGYSLIINNGQDKPHYILDPEGNLDIGMIPDFAVLPGWDDYNITQVLLDDVFQPGNSHTFDTGQRVDFGIDQIEVFKVAADLTETAITAVASVPAGTGTINGTDYVPANLPADVPNPTGGTGYAIYTDTETNTTVLQFGDTDVTAGDRIRVVIRSRNVAAIRCGVIRTFGDFLVAGDIREVEANDQDVIIRSLPGSIRTSDVAAPSAIPNNWNPNAAGVSTANEFTTTQSGIVQDMVQLQGQLYIYSNDGIYVMPNPGGGVPSQPQPVANGWGAQTTNAVIEFDGTHFVVGGQDIYLFSGHPGNIQSVADGRVRNYFYTRLNPLHEQRMFCLRYRQKDEIWICYPTTESITGECDEALIWNYRKNTWTVRDLYNVLSGDVGPVPGGGVPTQLIDLDGTSGNNGVTNIGAVEVQSLSMNPTLSLPGDTEGHQANWEITVDTDIPAYDTTAAGGLPIFDIVLGPNFTTGTNSPFHFYAYGRNADNEFTFNFEVALPAGITTKADLIDALEANPTFSTHFDIEDGSADDGEFVMDVLTEGTVTAAVRFGQQQLWQRSQLTRNTATDIPMSAAYFEADSENYQSIITSVFISPEQVGQYFYLNAPAGATFHLIPNVGGSQSMYDVTVNDTDMQKLNHMYGNTWPNDVHGARGGNTARPNRPNANDPAGTYTPGTGNANQFMYRIRQNDAQDFEQEQPWIPTANGMYEIEIRVPNGTTWTNRAWTFESYDAPDRSVDGMDVSFGLDPNRTHFPNVDFDNAPPVITITTGHEQWNSAGEGTWEENTDRTRVAAIALGGNYPATDSGLVRAGHIAEHISNVMHDDVADSYFTSQDSENVVKLVSRDVARHFLRLAVSANSYGVTNAHFSHTEVAPGLRGMFRTVSNPTVEELNTGLVQQAVYPTFLMELDMDQGKNYSVSTTVVNTDPSSRLTSAEMLEQFVEGAFDSDTTATNGWSSTTLPNGYAQPSQDTAYRLLAATERTDGNRAAREVPNTWQVSITNYGNLLPQGNVINTNFVFSRGNTTMNGYTVSSSNDFRGAFELKATPSYMALLVYNSGSGSPDNLEVIIVDAGTAGDYIVQNPQTGTNGVSLTAEQTAEKWIQDIRLANRRLNVLDRGTTGQFLIQPANYDDTANFVLEIAINNSVAGAARVWEMYISSLPTTDDLYEPLAYAERQVQTAANFRNVTPYRNEIGVGIYQAFMAASTAPTAVIDTDDSQISPSTTRRPDRTTRYNIMPGGSGILENTNPASPLDAVFDVDRPWPRSEVNFNKWYPIFAQNVVIGESRNTNKIVGADIGWSKPLFSDSERVQTIVGTDLRITAGTNDAPIPIHAWVRRNQLPLSPEFDVEQLDSIALWADGRYRPGFFDGFQYAKLYTESFTVDTPGVVNVGTNKLSTNMFYVSEDYKVDHRVTGRFLNVYVSDDNFDATLPDTETIDGKNFSKYSPWRVSGIQLEIMKGGHR